MSSRIDTASLTRLHWLGIALALLSGVVHLALAVPAFPGPFGIAFLVAAVGFFAGVVAILVNYRRRQFYIVGIPFTAGQIVIFAASVVFAGNSLSAVSIVDKVAQVAFMVVLVLLLQRE